MKYIFYVKIHLFVTANSEQDPNTEPHGCALAWLPGSGPEVKTVSGSRSGSGSALKPVQIFNTCEDSRLSESFHWGNNTHLFEGYGELKVVDLDEVHVFQLCEDDKYVNTITSIDRLMSSSVLCSLVL
jgi:hypothetical protein